MGLKSKWMENSLKQFLDKYMLCTFQIIAPSMFALIKCIQLFIYYHFDLDSQVLFNG
jgi:hypothetical protein